LCGSGITCQFLGALHLFRRLRSRRFARLSLCRSGLFGSRRARSGRSLRCWLPFGRLALRRLTIGRHAGACLCRGIAAGCCVAWLCVTGFRIAGRGLILRSVSAGLRVVALRVAAGGLLRLLFGRRCSVAPAGTLSRCFSLVRLWRCLAIARIAALLAVIAFRRGIARLLRLLRARLFGFRCSLLSLATRPLGATIILSRFLALTAWLLVATFAAFSLLSAWTFTCRSFCGGRFRSRCLGLCRTLATGLCGLLLGRRLLTISFVSTFSDPCLTST